MSELERIIAKIAWEGSPCEYVAHGMDYIAVAAVDLRLADALVELRNAIEEVDHELERVAKKYGVDLP